MAGHDKHGIPPQRHATSKTESTTHTKVIPFVTRRRLIPRQLQDLLARRISNGDATDNWPTPAPALFSMSL